MKKKPEFPVGFNHFKIRIEIKGSPGTGKSQMKNFIYRFLRENGFPTGLHHAHEHTIFTSLKD